MANEIDSELGAAIRTAQFPPTRLLGVETWAKQAGVTPEEFINAEIDGCIESGWGEAFRFFHTNHGRYPVTRDEKVQAAEERNLKNGIITWAKCEECGSRKVKWVLVGRGEKLLYYCDRHAEKAKRHDWVEEVAPGEGNSMITGGGFPHPPSVEVQMTDDAEKLMDPELRDALRKFMSAWMGEEEIQRLMTRPDGIIDAWNDTRRLPEGPKGREEILDFFVGLSSGLTQFFKQFHAESGRYPEFPSGGPIIGKLSDMH